MIAKVLESLVPSLRTLRTPLTAGLLWITAGFVFVARREVDEASEAGKLLAQLSNLADSVDGLQRTALVLFLAWSFGAVSVASSELLVAGLVFIRQLSAGLRQRRRTRRKAKKRLAAARTESELGYRSTRGHSEVQRELRAAQSQWESLRASGFLERVKSGLKWSGGAARDTASWDEARFEHWYQQGGGLERSVRDVVYRYPLSGSGFGGVQHRLEGEIFDVQQAIAEEAKSPSLIENIDVEASIRIAAKAAEAEVRSAAAVPLVAIGIALFGAISAPFVAIFIVAAAWMLFSSATAELNELEARSQWLLHGLFPTPASVRAENLGATHRTIVDAAAQSGAIDSPSQFGLVDPDANDLAGDKVEGV